jgi:peptide chain release factor subunit 3
MGTIIEGKIESGSIRKGSPALIMPNKSSISIEGVYTEADEEMLVATSGDQVRLRIKGVEEEDISVGFVLSSPKAPVHVVNSFEAQVAIIELKSLLSAGYGCVMHVHTAVVEVQFEVVIPIGKRWLTEKELLHKLNKLNQRSKKAPPYATKGQKIVARLRTATPICLERFDEYPMLGRFTLRDQGTLSPSPILTSTNVLATTVAIGKITKLLED